MTGAAVLPALGWFAAGLVTLIVGAEVLLRNGSQVAARLGVSPLIVGLTVVAVGTSVPELAIGVDAALADQGSITVGNVVGTNVVNILLVLGVSALLRPVDVRSLTVRYSLPVIVGVALLVLLMSLDAHLGRFEGATLVLLAVGYTAAAVRWSRRESAAVRDEYEEEYAEPDRGWRRIAADAAWLLGGIGLVVVGSDWLVDGASDMAAELGVSEAFVGLTVVAVGTSAPELVTSVVGTIRDDRDLAVGNLLGSSVYNIVFILGVVALIPSSGIDFDRDLVRFDIPVMTVVSMALAVVVVTGRKVTRREGTLFVGGYGAYLAYLLIARS